MRRWLPGICRSAFALSLAGLLANCGGGGGNNNRLQLFFGMNGDGSCNSVTVHVDLAASKAILEKQGQDVQCVLDSGLSASGCSATFTETTNALQVTIAGCTIPASTNLFSCVFADVDLAKLQTTTTAQCVCTTPGCDVTPPLCIDQNADPHSCENCTNGIDDDHNGKTDCNDPNCADRPECNGTTTTQQTTTSSTAPFGEPLPVTFLLTSSARPVADLQLTINYASAPGQMDGVGTDVSCTNGVAGATLVAEDKDSIRRLVLHLTKGSGFSAPTDLVTCQFLPREPVPVPANFTVVVNSATGTDGKPVSVRTGVIVGDGGVTTTTQETVTTTTLPEPLVTTFRLKTASAPPADLQFTVNYTSARGQFVGSGTGVDCTSLVGGATFTANDKDSTRRLTLHLAKDAGIPAPVDLVSCRFLPGVPAPSAANFSIVVDSATGTNANTVSVSIGTSLSQAP